MEFRSVLQAAQGEPVLLPRPVHVPRWQFRSGFSKVFPRACCELPCPKKFRRVQPDKRIRLINGKSQKAWAAFQHPCVLLKLSNQSCFDLRTWALLPTGLEFDRVKGNQRDFWSRHSQSVCKMAFPDAVCSGDDDLLQQRLTLRSRLRSRVAGILSTANDTTVTRTRLGPYTTARQFKEHSHAPRNTQNPALQIARDAVPR